MNKVKGEPMNIGLIGPGEIGAVIVKKLRDAGYPVKMANSKGPDSLRKLAAETGAKPVSVEEVVQDVDVLFIVLPQKATPELPKGLLNKEKKETISRLLHQSDERRTSEVVKKRGPFFAGYQPREGNEGTFCRRAQRFQNWRTDQEGGLPNASERPSLGA